MITENDIEDVVRELEKIAKGANELTLKVHEIFKGQPLKEVIFTILNLREGILRVDPESWNLVEEIFDQTKNNNEEGH